MVDLKEASAMSIAFVVFVIILAMGGSALWSIRGTQFTVITNNTLANCQANPAWANCSTVASNASASGLTGITNLSSNAPTIGLVIGAALLIGIVLVAFYMSRER